MYRFIAFAWDPEDPGQLCTANRLAEDLTAARSEWRTAYDGPGLRVFENKTLHSAYRAYVLTGDVGVVVGKLFHRDMSDSSRASVSGFDDAESVSVSHSQGRVLVDRYWGHYVLFLRGADRRTLHVLRDPSGGLPCYLVTRASIRVFLSDVDVLPTLGRGRLSVNWSHVVDFFIYNRLVCEATGLCELRQLSAGQCLTWKGERRSDEACQCYWAPSQMLHSELLDDPVQALTLLRDSILSCVAAWRSCYRNVVLELSGGLDSSVIAAGLYLSKQPPVTCFHYYTDHAAGDEREYARLTASQFGYELFEQPVSAGQRPLEQQLPTRRYATPALLGFVPESEIAKRALIDSRVAGAIFTGLGGDQLFQHGSNALLATESLRNRGIGPSSFRVILDSCRISKDSVWSTIHRVWRYEVLAQRYDPYGSIEAPSLLARDAKCLSTSSYRHPWTTMAQGLPASKVDLILALIDTQLFNARPYSHADRIHPLISQPVLDCCLLIPSYVMALGGVSRGLVRQAFRDTLPPEVVDRKSKGATTGYFNNFLLHNLPAIRAFLLDGCLTRVPVVDRVVLERELSQSRLISGREIRPVLNAIRAEAWLRSWEDLT